MMHINEETAKKLIHNELDMNEKCEYLAHIALCGDCAELLARVSEPENTVPVPAGFEESVMLSAFGEDDEKKRSGTRSFTYYTLKIIAAMCASLILLFAGVGHTCESGYLNGILEKTEHYSERFEKKLEDFSKNRYNEFWEENFNANQA